MDTHVLIFELIKFWRAPWGSTWSGTVSRRTGKSGYMFMANWITSVSYTHLDVYKRQRARSAEFHNMWITKYNTVLVPTGTQGINERDKIIIGAVELWIDNSYWSLRTLDSRDKNTCSAGNASVYSFKTINN